MKNRAKDLIEQYVERFDYHINDYKSGNYNESQARTDFINPFFEALGWDINNKAGLAESYREVIYEDKIKVAGSTKAPDYCFTVYGQKKFFVEAKKPKVNIKDQIEPAYQLRRYGWSAKLPISLITDFEEFAVYDCLSKPNPTDKASVGRIKYINYKDYIKEFDFIWDVFSKEQVLKGSFDRFVSSSKGKKGTAGVDAEFLKSLDTWRDLIARNIVNRNANITEDELNFATQKLIDRLIFLRICEDRGVELENQLMGCVGKDSFLRLKQIFHIADQKYNSGLFDYKKDKITDTLSIDDKVLKEIIEDMYYPKSPYEFSVIPVEIMGHSYEQYLGKVMRITPGHRIKIEEKPEVRKAGGVYYTPEYIVNYIVENTVGKLIDGKTPEEVSKIKICDPACGSGSFLLGAYQYLLNWHKNYYSEAKIKNKDKYITPEGNLTTSVKKQILLNNIFGVDIDTNAVEVTKLSLMLKAMEGETTASINQQLSLMHDKVLPTLDDNIKSGNSLIDLDFYENELDFEPGMEKKIKPFNWQSAFPQVFKQGGFDAVIGNPPYVGRSTSFDDLIKRYIKNSFLSSEGKFELYHLFIEKSTKIINRHNGVVSFITPQTWLSIVQAFKLRRYLITEFSLERIVVLGKDVFSASVDTVIFFLKSGKTSRIECFCPNPNQTHELTEKINNLDMDDISNIDYIIAVKQNRSVNKFITRVRNNCVKLDCIGSWYDGVKVVGSGKAFAFQKTQVDDSFKPMYIGKDISRYSIDWSGFFCCRNKESILSRNVTDIRLRKESVFQTEKILVRKTGDSLVATVDSNKYYYEQSLFSFSLKDMSDTNIYYVLAIINSKTATYFLKTEAFSMKDTFPQIRLHWLKDFPIPANPSPEAQAQLIKLVDTMLQLNKDLQAATLPEQKEQLQARISYTDKKIDQLVYQLYELTEEEIKIVEGE